MAIVRSVSPFGAFTPKMKSEADQIVVLDDGAVVGIGRHDDLLATCPTYREIVESQLTAEEVA